MEEYEGTLFTCYSLDTALEGSGLMEGSEKLPESMVCSNAHPTNIGDSGDSLHFIFSEE